MPRHSLRLPGAGQPNEEVDVEQRSCERCGRENNRPKATLCFRCKKALENAKYRSTTAPDPFDSFDCEWCGTRCVRGVDVVAHASRFCCVVHKKAWHRQYSEAPSYGKSYYEPVKRWPQCRLSTRVQLAQGGRCCGR